MKPNKTPSLHQIDDYQLPNKVLVGLMGDVLAQGCKFKFQAKGASMSPFIRDKDNITIDPIRQVKPSMGRVVAYTCSNPQKLLVHRIVDADSTSFLLKGDNSLAQPDGWFLKEKIIGVVTRVERRGTQIKFGLGVERLLIAYLSKKGLLVRIINRLRRVIKI
jgi:hypothetical protein